MSDDGAPLVIEAAEELDGVACLEVADGRELRLGDALIHSLALRRDQLLSRLERGDAVYGVSTGMGAASTVRLDREAQGLQQENLMRARSVGSAPWLSPVEARAAMAVRLRTFLGGDAGVSPELCLRLVELLNRGVIPAIPSTRLGAAGEIIPLAHLGAVLTGEGDCLSGPASDALARVDLEPFRLGPKEGVAMIEGVPVTTGLALLRARESRILGSQSVTVFAMEAVLIGANLDPFRDEVVRRDAELLAVAHAVRDAVGPEAAVSALQAPLSFRVAGHALAHLDRSASSVEAAVDRALGGVTDSPAFVGDDFVGTAGFDGFDLAASLDALRVAVIHLAELSAARLHRLLDDRVTGLPRQLSDRPGLHAGMVAVHKRAVGVVHDLVRTSAPSSLGAIETSLGQEDVQSFSVEAAVSVGRALDGARDVLACELLAVTQARRLGGATGIRTARLLDAIDEVVEPGTADRPYGRDLDAILVLLRGGWALTSARRR